MSETVCANFGESLTFLWIEFMDPQDGVGFSLSAKGGGKKFPPLINLLDCAISQKANLTSLPIPRSLENVGIQSSRRTENILIYEFSRGKSTGRVAYSSQRITFAGEEGAIGEPNDSWYNSPNIETSNGSISPHIYILSGHGSQGKVYGEGERVGGVYLHSLIPTKDMRILIVPACSNINISRAFRLQALFQDNTMFAILGYEHTYHGGAGGFDVMKIFVDEIRNGKPIIDSWKKANEAKTVKLYPWSAIVCPAPNNAHEKYTLEDIIHEPDLIKNSWTSAVFYSNTYPDGRQIKKPPISAYFIKDALSSAESDESLFSRLEKFWIEPGTEKVFEINSTTEREFKQGECLAVLFYVVRPDWTALDLPPILSFDEKELGENATIKLQIQDGHPIVFVNISKNTKKLHLKTRITKSAKAKLCEAAFKDRVQNPSDLLCHCMHGRIVDGKFEAIAYNKDGVEFIGAKIPISDLKSSVNWINKPYAFDLRIFPSRFSSNVV